MKKMKKILSALLAAATLSSVCAIPAFAAWKWPVSYDMENINTRFPTSQIAQWNDGVNGEFTADPTDSDNTVLSTRRSNVENYMYPSIRAVMEYTEAAIQFDFDIYRDDKSDSFNVKLFANTGSASGNNKQLMTLDQYGNVKLDGSGKKGDTNLTSTNKIAAGYDVQKWYSFRIKTNKAKTYHEFYMKERGDGEYKYIGYVENPDLEFSKQAMNYLLQNNSFNNVYLDNMSWTALDGDLSKQVHYDFNDVVTKKAKYFPDLNINTSNMTYEQATFDGAQVIKSTMNETGVSFTKTWEDIPDIDRVVISARMGMDSEGNEAANLPAQFGLMPIFALADGTKSTAARNEEAQGIRFERSRFMTVEGKLIQKNASDGLTKLGYNINDGRLYDVGYVYDRENKVFKAYVITNNGETVVVDATEVAKTKGFVDEQRYLAGVALWTRADATYKTGKAYYDYLYIDEAQDFTAESITPAANSTDVSLAPEIRVKFNYVIDPSELGSVTITGTNNETVEAELSTDNGYTLVIKPKEKLASSTAYTVKVTGVKDLLGQSAGAETTFTTGSPIKLGEVTLNSDNKIIDGNNVINYSMSSNDGSAYTVALVAALFDIDTGAMIDAKAIPGDVAADGSETKLTLEYDTSAFSNYRMEVYVWSGLDSMKPYTESKPFTK